MIVPINLNESSNLQTMKTMKQSSKIQEQQIEGAALRNAKPLPLWAIDICPQLLFWKRANPATLPFSQRRQKNQTSWQLSGHLQQTLEAGSKWQKRWLLEQVAESIEKTALAVACPKIPAIMSVVISWYRQRKFYTFKCTWGRNGKTAVYQKI